MERLLAEGDKVKVAVMFRGREMSHPEIGRQILEQALENLKEVAVMERPPSMEGRFLNVILTPSVKKGTPTKEKEKGKEKEDAPVEEHVG